MNRNWMIGFMFVLFILEGTLLPLIIPDMWQGRIIPQFIFIAVLYHGVYQHRHTALIMGLAFGFLQDIVYYGHMIGPHAFSMGLLGYLAGLLFPGRNITLIPMMAAAVMGSFLYQTILFAIYSLFNLSKMTYEVALFDYLIPSLFVQLLFALAIYVPMRKWFDLQSGTAENEQD
ncbi:MAG: rod shape-determining protein MreD [Paenibacillus dendritiformis]|uniref:rod shape-determining protein MreD n=1 Tax=Paenibacillus dendritiformis TaxID=130049 RepID=UPI00143CFCF5|nr:rod shape-determining protein MreD [Paenibacillus dendritiformis]MDU5144825.1 rod shape-determining protein MreD [Paenibacillus dendritiformis]NKI23858.1 rod shape-determining protein MreD [Paenibacillus dendritiformis]NRF97065.1 rod shape-determining protein MreD [Paenibacillus dendritiformis]GIO72129.1 hypothetical protein J27TS7_16430 [Paenibacillus dendritiformis]